MINETHVRDFVVMDVIKHPDFDRAVNHHDIAIVKLARATDYCMYIRPICLPKLNMELTNKSAIVAGKNSNYFFITDNYFNH